MEHVLEALGRLFSGEFFVSLPFWSSLVVAVSIYRLVPGKGTLKTLVLLGCNTCMLLSMPRFNGTMLAILGGMCVLTYLIGARLNSASGPSRGEIRRLWAAAGVASVLCLLIFFKYSYVQEAVTQRGWLRSFGAEGFVFLIGISYSSFKAMHFIFEAYKRTLKELSFLGFANYIFFFPGFISGPINRYNHFIENSSGHRKVGFRDDFAPGARRIVDGLFKKTVLTSILFPFTLNNWGVPIDEMSREQILTGLCALALYFYFDFSGYTDLAIGSARWMGFVLPENFNYPFLKKNIQQLWANWHMSLTGWLTDYIYWPLVRKLRNGDFWRKRPILVSNVAILVTFLICGVWHGETLNFAVWGLYQGLGIACVNTYQNWKRKVRNGAVRKYFASRWSHSFGCVMTFGFFAIGQSLFVLDIEQAGKLIVRLIGF